MKSQESSLDLNCWTIEYTTTKKDKEICRSVHKTQKRRRMFSCPLKETHPAVENGSNASSQHCNSVEILDSHILPATGTVFVETEESGKETRWMIFKTFPATMKIRARNDFNVVKTFKWPQENIKVISFGEDTGGTGSDSKSRKDDEVEISFSTLDLDYKNLTKLLHFNHSRRKAFLSLGSLSKIPLDVYLVACFKYYLITSEDEMSVGNSMKKTQLGAFPKPPNLDMFCEFLASLTSLFDGALKEVENLAYYMLENQDFCSWLFQFVKFLIQQCREVIESRNHSNRDEESSLENRALNVLNGFIVINNLLYFEHNYHSNFTYELCDVRCYVCEEWCLLEDMSCYNHFLFVILQDATQCHWMRHLSNRIRQVAMEFWTLCFASNICESGVLDDAFQELLREKNFYAYVLEPLLKRHANKDIMAMKLLQKILESDYLEPNLFLEEQSCFSQGDKLQPFLNNWLSDIASKTPKRFFNSWNRLRLRVVYLMLRHHYILERLLTNHMMSFTSVVLNLLQVGFSVLFEYNSIDCYLETDHDSDRGDNEQNAELYGILFQFFSLLGIPNVGHSLCRYILSNHFTSQRSLEKLGRVLWKLPLEVHRSMVTHEECHRYHIVNIVFESYRGGNVDRRTGSDVEYDGRTQEMSNSKFTSPFSETDEPQQSLAKVEISTADSSTRYFESLCQHVRRMKPMEFSGILEELQDFAKYVLESELMRLKGDDSKPAPFVRLKRNEYTCDYIGPIRGKGEMDKVMVCHCSSVGDAPCCVDSSCLNRASFTECHPEYCRGGNQCQNQRFQKCEYARVKLFPAGERGWGLKTMEFLPKGTFIIEYQGEVIEMEEYERRKKRYTGEKHFYFMSLDSDHMIDASRKSNMARFINHSCQPNCHTEKWTVVGEPCVGIFASQGKMHHQSILYLSTLCDWNFRY